MTMTMAFGKLLHCIVLIRACLPSGSRSFYLLLNEKVFSSISAVLIRDFQSVHPKNLLALQYVRNFLHSCITCLYLSYLSIDLFDRVTASLFFASWCRSRRCHRYKEKNFQKPDLCFGGLGNFPKKSYPRQIIFISIIAFKRYVAHFLKRCPYK